MLSVKSVKTVVEETLRMRAEIHRRVCLRCGVLSFDVDPNTSCRECQSRDICRTTCDGADLDREVIRAMHKVVEKICEQSKTTLPRRNPMASSIGPINYKGQRYEIRCRDENGDVVRLGWSNTPLSLMSTVELDPDWYDHHVVDLRAPTYGRCPHCRVPGKMRERRPHGNDTCENGHVYPSSASIEE